MNLLLYRVFSSGCVSEGCVADPGDRLCLYGRDAEGAHQQFESEAWHLGCWADAHGFRVERHELVLDLDSRRVLSWR